MKECVDVCAENHLKGDNSWSAMVSNSMYLLCMYIRTFTSILTLTTSNIVSPKPEFYGKSN